MSCVYLKCILKYDFERGVLDLNANKLLMRRGKVKGKIMMNCISKIKEAILMEIDCHLPKELVHSRIYYRVHKKWPNLICPETYDEYIQWLMVNVYDESYSKYADKLEVRKYVKACGLGDLLIPVFGTYKRANEIDYDALPNEFVLMTNHGSGEEYYVICTDKSKLDKDKTNRKLNAALKKHFWKRLCEYQYKNIPPRILCMKYLKLPGSDRLTDYKVVCINGKATRILVCTERNEGRDYYSTDWKYLDHVFPQYRSGELLERPKCLEQMLQAAERLSAPFPLARIDFYEVMGKLYFGEITLTPSTGCHKNLNEKGQLEWRERL